MGGGVPGFWGDRPWGNTVVAAVEGLPGGPGDLVGGHGPPVVDRVAGGIDDRVSLEGVSVNPGLTSRTWRTRGVRAARVGRPPEPFDRSARLRITRALAAARCPAPRRPR